MLTLRILQGGGVLPYMTYIGTCVAVKGNGFQVVWTGTGYRNQEVLVQNRVSVTGKLISGVENLVPNRL